MCSICPFLMACLLLPLPANALFLAGQIEQDGEISILCEGQSSVFLSLPSGDLRALPLDSDSQAKFIPTSYGPHTFQCGNETATVAVSPPAREDSGAYSSGENILIVSWVAIVFLAALFISAKVFLRPRTTFLKSGGSGRVKLLLRAGEDLRAIKIADPQGGEDGEPIVLVIPRLPAGATWGWEYECTSGEPLLAAHLSAKGAKGGISLFSCGEHGGIQRQKASEKNKREIRKLAKHSG